MARLARLLQASLVLGAIGGPAAWAADLTEAYRDAAASDPQLRQVAANREATQEVKPQARALLLPDLRATGSYDRTYNFDNDALPDSASKGSYDSRNYSLTLSQPIYNRETQYRIKQADSAISQADETLVSAQQKLITQVTELYFQVLSALDTLTFTIADKSAIARQLEQAKRRFEVGLITITDVYEAQARFDLANASEIEARNQVSKAREALRQVTGKEYPQFNVLDPKAPLDPVEPANADAWVTMAINNNPDIRSARFAVDSARDNIEVQRSGHYPTLGLKATKYDNNEGIVNRDADQIGVELTIPLYQGGAVSSRTRQAAYEYQAAQEALERTQREVIRNTRDSYRGLETARSRVKALEQARISNQSSLEATQAGFDVGTRTIVDVLNAERDLLRAIRDLSVSRYDYIINRLRLLEASGQISDRAIEAVNRWLRPAPPGQLERGGQAEIEASLSKTPPSPVPPPAPGRPPGREATTPTGPTGPTGSTSPTGPTGKEKPAPTGQRGKTH
jgi:outer membrane protein